MADPRNLSDKDRRLLAAIDAFETRSYGSDKDPDLAADRAGALNRYLGVNIDPAPVGRSQVRDRSVFEVVEWTKPSLLRIFTSGEEIARFDPVGPEDVEQAAQESDYINWVITQKNNWFQVCNDLISDGLLLKNGYLHAYWDDSKVVESEFYENLTDDAFALLAADPEVTIAAHDQRPDDEANKRNQAAYQQQMAQWQQAVMQMQQQMQMQPPQPGQPPPQPPPQPQKPPPAFLHDVELKRTNTRGQVKLCTLAPERCLVDVDTPDHTLDGCNYFEHYEWRTLGQLRASGIDVPDDISDASDENERDFEVESARDLYSEDANRQWGEDFEDRSMRRVRVRRIWMRHDYDGDGINEMQYVIRVGSQILYRREVPEIPVASWSPIPLAHRHVGQSLADSVKDIEDINSDLIRQGINNLNLSNTPRIVASDRVNMSDLLDVRVGGVVRVEGQPPQELMPLTVPNVFPDVANAINFFDSRRQNRTGINAYFQGTDANTLNKTASGVAQLTNSAAQRVETIGRYLATAIERAFLIVHRIILEHGHASEVIKLRNKWVTVDPSQWRKRTDVKISVGLGTGNRESLIAQLSGLFQSQMAVVPMGVAQPANLYATLFEIAKASGLTTPERFVTDPATLPPPQPQPPPQVLVEQERQKGEAQKFQAETQVNQQKDQMQAQLDLKMKEMDLQQERWKAQFDRETRLMLEQMKIQADAAQKDKELTVSMQSGEADRAHQSMMGSVDAKAQAVAEVMSQFGELRDAIANLINFVGSQKVVGVEKIRDPRTGRMVAARRKLADGSVEDITIQ